MVESKWEFQELINFCPSSGSHLIGNFQFELKSGIMFFKRERDGEGTLKSSWDFVPLPKICH